MPNRCIYKFHICWRQCSKFTDNPCLVNCAHLKHHDHRRKRQPIFFRWLNTYSKGKAKRFQIGGYRCYHQHRFAGKISLNGHSGSTPALFTTITRKADSLIIRHHRPFKGPPATVLQRLANPRRWLHSMRLIRPANQHPFHLLIRLLR